MKVPATGVSLNTAIMFQMERMSAEAKAPIAPEVEAVVGAGVVVIVLAASATWVLYEGIAGVVPK